jgi:LysM repeat protein
MIKWEPKNDGFFTSDFIEKLKKQNFLDKDIKKIIDNAKDALSKTINPKNPELNNEIFKTNLVLGYIQSGKTTSMEAVACMARDNGFKLMIILSGHVSNLAEQTEERVYESLDQFGWNRIQIKPGKKAELEKDFGLFKDLIESDETLFITEEEKPAGLIVLMKQHQRIGKLIDIIEHAEKNNLDLSKMPTLIFDDEADHYSLDAFAKTKRKEFNKKQEAKLVKVEEGDTLESFSRKFQVSVDNLKYLNGFENEENRELKIGETILIERPETTTHRQIKKLRRLLRQHSYLGYTATPVANFLIAQVSHLSPQSATVLEPGSQYTGANFFFGDEKRFNDHIKLVKEENIVKNKEKPDSLVEALKVFLIGVTYGLMNNDHLNKKVRTMLVHPSTSRPVHTEWRNWIKTELDIYKRSLDSKANNIAGKSNRIDMNYHKLEDEFLEAHKEVKKTEKNLPDWNDEFVKKLYIAVNKIISQVVLFNAEKGGMPPIDWGKDGVYARILVGGIGLERGYTIGGLTVSYIVRETGTDDTVYQRARFFGYHKPYIGLVRMYLPPELIKNFSQQQENEIVIREKIKEVVLNGGDLRKDLKRAFPFIGKAGPARQSIIEHNLKKFPHGAILSDHRAHHLDDTRLQENKDIYDALSNLKNKIKFSQISDHAYAKNLDGIDVIEKLSLLEISNQYIKNLNYYNDTNEDDYSIITELSDWRNSVEKEDIDLAILIMRDKDEQNFKRRVDRDLFENKNSSIPIESGANLNRPGHAYLHYEFMINAEPKWHSPNIKNSPYGTPIEGNGRMKANKIATIQLYKFDIHSLKEQGDELLAEGVPYFRIYVPKKMGKGFRVII